VQWSTRALERELAATRSRGYGVADAEILPGACCIGAPVIGPDGEFVAAVVVAAPKWLYPPAAITAEVAPRAIIAAADIAERIRLRVDAGEPSA